MMVNSFKVDARKKILLRRLASAIAACLVFLSLSAEANTFPIDVKRGVPATSLGHSVAISSHNCYFRYKDLSSAENRAETIRRIHQALDEQADLIELDLLDVNGDICVAHEEGQPAAAEAA